jgi:formate dehydrogenase iron-sulfur subunit
MARAILYDSTLCVGCRQCEEACSARWKLPYNDKIAAEERTSAHKLTTIRTYGERFSRKLCNHCQDPACASVCPVAALRKTEAGPVIYDEDRCMGCRYCMAACPFQVPSYEWEARLPKVRKCDLCADRVSTKEPSRCCEACPTGASITGERDALIVEARKRLVDKPKEYYQRIYGIEEVGGTSVLYLSAVPFEQIGLNTQVARTALPQYTWNALQHIPDVVVMGTVLLGGIHWISHRREQVAREEGRRR